MEINKNEEFFKDVLKNRIVSIKNIEDFDVARSYFKRGLIVTLDFSLELVRIANKADKLIRNGNFDHNNHSILLSVSDFNLKYIDVDNLNQLENLKKSFRKSIENMALLKRICPKDPIRKRYTEDTHAELTDEVAKESIFSKTKTFFKKVFGKKELFEAKTTVVSHEIKEEIVNDCPIIEEKSFEYKFTPSSKEIWQYYNNVSKDKYFYKKAEEWGMILEYIIDFEKIKEFDEKLLFDVIDFSVRRSLGLRSLNIEKCDVERVFDILKANWKYGYLLQLWQEIKYEERSKVKEKTLVSKANF